jgi:hypothetical protein
MHQGNSVVRIDLFFGSFDAQSFLLSIWTQGYYQPCFYPNSGFSYANFFGMPMLAPLDQNAFHTANYGPDYLNPKETTGYVACTKASILMESNRIQLRSQHISFMVMCTAHSASCPSPHAREVLLKRMLIFIDRVALEHGLQYVAACDSHRYLSDSQQVPPMYGSIAIPHEQRATWMAKLGAAVQITTFKLTRGSSDGEIVRLRYSHYSPVFVGVWTGSASVFQQTKDASYGNPSDSPVSVKMSTGPSNEDLLSDICHGCKECEKMPSGPRQSGRLMNVNTGLCLSFVSPNRTTLINCNKVCVSTVESCVIHLVARV